MSIDLPSQFSAGTHNSGNNIHVNFEFETIDESIDFIETLFTIKPDSIDTDDIIKYLIKNLTQKSVNIIIDMMKYRKNTVDYVINFLALDKNRSIHYKSLVDYIIENFSNDIPITSELVERSFRRDHYIFEKLLEAEILSPNCVYVQRILAEFFLRDPNSANSKYLIGKGVSLEFTLKHFLKNTRGIFDSNIKSLSSLLMTPAPSGIDPNKKFESEYYGDQLTLVEVALIIQDYDAFIFLIERGGQVDMSSTIFDEIEITDTAFYEYFSENGISIKDLVRKTIFSFLHFDVEEIVENIGLGDDVTNDILKLQKRYEDIINLGADPRGLNFDEVVEIGDVEDFREITTLLFDYLNNYEYSLFNISLFTLNDNNIATNILPPVFRRGNAEFNFVEVLKNFI